MVKLRSIALGLLLVVAGCSSPGDLVQRHEPQGDIAVHEVTTAGTYGLFIAGESDPLLQYPLRVGDRLGFDSAAKPVGEQLKVQWLYAIAGNDRRRLDVRETYEWRRLPDGK